VSENNGDPVGDFQRWLMKQGAKGIGRQVADRVRSTVGGPSAKADPWETATTEPPPGEPPECQWCPICRAARMAQQGGGPGLSTVGDTLANLAQDAFSVLDNVLRTIPKSSDNGPVVGTGLGRPVIHPEHEHREPADEGGHGAERRDTRDVPSDRGRQQQVGWPAE
jgi:hypothetical protein